MRRPHCHILASALLLVTLLAAPLAAQAAEPLSVRFSWRLKGEYAAFYLGQERGLFARAGLDVRFGEGAGPQAAVAGLIHGGDDLVVMPGIFAISAIQMGAPIRIVALYQPQAPVLLVSHADHPVVRPEQLAGRSLAYSLGEPTTAYLTTFCGINRIDCGRITRIIMDSRARIPYFLQRRVDLISVYRTTDLPVLEDKAGPLAVLDLAAYGLHIPGMAVVASERTIAARPQALRRFLAATAQAFAATRRDPLAASRAIQRVWVAGPKPKVVDAQVRATMATIPAVPGRALGWIDPALVRAGLELVRRENHSRPAKPIQAFYTNALLPQVQS
ncbi:ABC transporter substrate-binding protein [Sphingomonas sp.]|uniref:ABC transporter substrate-binding protein n=1 Tax=Sphingomonas sp. TaxID=28214 RepID=UPI001B129092|nr:ABC transporter substrate-binding protein [Sphingomonas sp.]MBO9711671.1 ABC transporter substrate-binding protein [Sphingomonas sp.]